MDGFEENLTVKELQFVCETFFDNKPLDMLNRMIARHEQAKKQNNLRLFNLLAKDISTMKKTTEIKK